MELLWWASPRASENWLCCPVSASFGSLQEFSPGFSRQQLTSSSKKEMETKNISCGGRVQEEEEERGGGGGTREEKTNSCQPWRSIKKTKGSSFSHLPILTPLRTLSSPICLSLEEVIEEASLLIIIWLRLDQEQESHSHSEGEVWNQLDLLRLW